MVFSRVPDRCRDDSQHLVRISQGGLLTRFGLRHLSTYDEYTPDHDDSEGREQTVMQVPTISIEDAPIQTMFVMDL
jgi:hypothetical protein